jgi:hypothetical protein
VSPSFMESSNSTQVAKEPSYARRFHGQKRRSQNPPIPGRRRAPPEMCGVRATKTIVVYAEDSSRAFHVLSRLRNPNKLPAGMLILSPINATSPLEDFPRREAVILRMSAQSAESAARRLFAVQKRPTAEKSGSSFAASAAFLMVL